MLPTFVAVNVVSYSGAAMFPLPRYYKRRLLSLISFDRRFVDGDLLYDCSTYHSRTALLCGAVIVGGVAIFEMAPSPAQSSLASGEDFRRE